MRRSTTASALLTLIVAIAMAATACQQSSGQVNVTNNTVSPRMTPLPQDISVEAYFNHNPANQYTEPYRQTVRLGDDLETIIVETIMAARSTVDVAVQELRSPKIAQALRDRHQAGVRVRVVVENTYARPWSSFTPEEVANLSKREQERYREALQLLDMDGDEQLSSREINQRDALVILRTAGVPIIDDTADGSRGSNLMHHKFVVVDNQQVIVTSANFTTSDLHGDFSKPASRGNANNLLRIDSQELATLFTQEMNLMWGDGPGNRLNSRFGIKKPFRPARQVRLGNTRITVQFSPVRRQVSWQASGNGLIGKTLAMANQSVNLALFVFSEQTLANILEQRHQNGVQINALIDPGFAYRYYSDGLDMLGVQLSNNCKFPLGNRPWQNPVTTVGVPRLLPGDLLHHKMAVVDKHVVITGSQNWSTAANYGNDETIIVVESPLVAAHYQREFERLFDRAILGVPPAIRRKIEKDQQACRNLRAESSTLGVMVNTS
ncbi:MAG: phospholipase D-like domain-containing protein [Cyanobacteriota bacterium SKYGB_h_bin112]|nr:phospholipase D-like domain-containing protein [Cyanobacteriota bacterium SKYGB_h_bin112]